MSRIFSTVPPGFDPDEGRLVKFVGPSLCTFLPD
jgi:hypothetical protein